MGEDFERFDSLDDLFGGLAGAEPEERRRKPFKFLDPYGPEDKDIFFGRESEVAEIFSRFYRSRLLVVYGESGSGKTSLIQCGLRSGIPSEDVQFLSIRSALDPLEALRREVLKYAPFPGPDEPPPETVDLLREAIFLKSKPLALIFDQFEEFFIFQPESSRERFVRELAGWLEADLNLRVILCIREEYLAHLSELEASLPRLYRNRLWVRRMSREQAREVISGPCLSCGVEIDSELTEELLDVLTRGGKGVELPILQVVLDTLYQRAIEDSPEVPVLSFAAYFELGKVESILGRFIEDKVSAHDNPDQARQILKALVSPEGTRRVGSPRDIAENAVQFGEPIPDEELTRALERLMDDRIIREDAENHLYELRHDTLAQTIRQWMTGLEQELMEVRQTLENRHREFLARGTLLDAATLEYMAPYESRLKLKDELANLVAESRKVAVRRRMRRRLLAFGTILVVAGLVTGALQYRTERAREKTRLMRVAHENAAGSVLLLATQKPEGALVRSVNLARESMTNFHTLLPEVASSIHGLLQQHRLKTRFGPASGSTAVACAPGGEFSVSGDDEGMIYLREGDVTRPLISFRGHLKRVTGLVVTPEAEIVSASLDGTVRMRSRSGELSDVARFGENREPTSLAFDAARGLLLVGDSLGSVHVIALADKSPLTVWEAYPPVDSEERKKTTAVRSVTWLGAGRVLSLGEDGVVKFWTERGEKERDPLAAGESPVTALMASRSGDAFVTGDKDGTLRFWDATGHAFHASLSLHTSEVTALAVDGQGLVLASGALDGSICLATFSGTALPRVSAGRERRVNALAFSPSGEDLLSAEDVSARGMRLQESKKGTLGLWAAVDTSVGLPVASGGRPLGLSSANGHTLLHWLTDGRPPEGMALSTIALDTRMSLRTVSLETYKRPGERGEEVRVDSGMAVDPESGKIAGGTSKGYLIMWDADGRLRFALPDVHPQGIARLSFLAGGNRLVTMGYGGTLRFWTRDGRPVTGLIPAHEGAITAYRASLSGDRLATIGEDGIVRLWNANGETAGVICTGHRGVATAVAFGPVGDLIASGSRDGEVCLWTPTGEKRGPWRDEAGAGVSDLAFSDDGLMVIVGTEQGRIQLLLTSDLKPAAPPIPGHQDRVSGIFALPGSRGFVTCGGDHDQVARLWNAEPGAWMKEACSRMRYLGPDLEGEQPALAFCKDVLAETSPGPRTLLDAVASGHVDEVRRFLEEARSDPGNRRIPANLVQAAVWSGSAETLSLLIRSGIDVNSPDDQGRTALHEAAATGRRELAAVLLRAGANPDARDNRGNTALIYSAMRHDTELAGLLITARAQLDVANESGKTALQLAVAMGHGSIATALREAGASDSEPPRPDFTLGAYVPVESRLVPSELHPLVREGLRHELGEGEPLSLERAAEFYRQAAEAGDAYGQFKLGRAFYFGAGVPRDCAETVRWYRASAEQGNTWGMNNLASCYSDGHCVARDMQESIRLYREAVEGGNAWSANNLAFLYEDGNGVRRSYEHAAVLYERALELGFVRVPAYRLGSLHALGRGVDYDPGRAAELFGRAAEAGNVGAMHDLAWLYESGEGIQASDALAAEWYRRAAEKGLVRAQTKLGWMYERGKGVPKSPDKAAEWYGRAADQGDVDAMLSLGWLYETGQGVVRSPARAAELYRKAADKGRVEAVELLKRLEKTP